MTPPNEYPLNNKRPSGTEDNFYTSKRPFSSVPNSATNGSWIAYSNVRNEDPAPGSLKQQNVFHPQTISSLIHEDTSSQSPETTDSNQPLYTGSNSQSSKPRIRVAKACDRCKYKKTKCDGMNPCQACVKHKLPCIYTPSAFTKGREPSNTDSDPANPEHVNKDGSAISAESLSAAVESANEMKTMPEKRTAIIGINKPAILARLRDRITVLENDLARLAHQVQTENNNKPKIEPSHLDKSVAPPMIFNPNPLLGQAKKSSPRLKYLYRVSGPNKSSDYAESENPGDNLEQELKCALRNHKSKMRYSRRYANYLPFRMGTALTETLPEDMKKKVNVPRVQCYGWNMSGVHYLKPRVIPAPQSNIPEKMARELLSYFFKNINPLFSILHEPMFMEQYDAYLLSPDKRECRLFMAIYHVVCAISMRFREVSKNDHYEQGLEERLFDDGYATLQAFSFEWESLEIVQGYLLLSLYLRACHRQPSAWGALGTAIRMARGMGLMYKMQPTVFPSEYDTLRHERIFWACFVMDRTLCIETGRHFSFREDSITIPFPHYYIDDGWQTPISNALLRFCLSLGDLVFDRDLNLNTNDLASIKARLITWNEGMADFGFNSDTELDKHNLPPALTGHLRLCYYNSLFFIHMRTVFGLLGSQWDTPHLDKQLYVMCVKGVVDVTTTLSKLGQLKTPWWLVLSNLYYAGCVSLLLIYNQVNTIEMGEALHKILELITELVNDGRFSMARECLWSLKMLNHMVKLKFGQTQEMLESLGIDPPPKSLSKINRDRFTSMGYLDPQGREILQINMENKQLSEEREQHQEQHSSEQQQQQLLHQQLPQQQFSLHPPSQNQPQTFSDLNSTFPLVFDTNTAGLSVMTEFPAFDGVTQEARADTQMSLDWFNNWDWDVREFDMAGASQGANSNIGNMS